MIRHHLHTHKRKYIWSTSIILVVLLILYVYLRISATLHFSLQTELLATHTPTQLVIDTTNNVTVPINIQTSISTFHACESVCDYYVDDIYSLNNKSEKKITHQFTISTPTTGFGQQLFYFKSSCKTIPSTFCPSSQKSINQTSLIVIDYSLQKDEQRIISNIDEIKNTLEIATNQIEQMRYAKQLFLVWPQQGVKLLDDKVLTDLLSAFSKSWKQENYLHANSLLQAISDTFENVTAVNILLDQIQAYTHLQKEISEFLANESVREYVEYAQKYDSDAGTVRQAITRLSTIVTQKYIPDLERSQAIATGAILYLTNKTEQYEIEKLQAQTEIEFAKNLLPLIKTNLMVLPLEICNATQSINAHNDWASSSEYSLIDVQSAKIIVQPVNSTFVFNLPDNFCVENILSVPIQIPLKADLDSNTIKVPTPINLSAPQINLPVAHCSVGDVSVNCTQSRAPVIFIHGHAFDESNSPQVSMIAFSQLQEKLEKDGYVNAGELDTSFSERIFAPFTMRASFYYIQQFGVGSYAFEIQKSERIENYALRLKEIIEDVKQQSGSSNVTIIAHSMGGLVVREYANLFGYSNINRVITINTPHQGITGRTASICDVIGAAKECEDMTANSTFLRRLPQIEGQWDVIASSGCQMKDGVGDGVVLVGNSLLPGSKYHLINGSCTDALESNLHTMLLEDERVYELVAAILN